MNGWNKSYPNKYTKISFSSCAPVEILFLSMKSLCCCVSQSLSAYSKLPMIVRSNGTQFLWQHSDGFQSYLTSLLTFDLLDLCGLSLSLSKILFLVFFFLQSFLPHLYIRTLGFSNTEPCIIPLTQHAFYFSVET